MHARRWGGTVLAGVWMVLGVTSMAVAFPFAQEFETSIRAAGMGGATTAVTWGEPGPWGNPASLARTRGIGWLEGRTRLVPELYSETRIDSRRFLFGAAGVGVSLMGVPDGFGETRFSYEIESTDALGNPVRYELGETVKGWGIGVSPLQLVDAIRAVGSPGAPALSRWGDVSFGWSQKRTEVTRFPNEKADQENHDWGILGRIAPLRGEPSGRGTLLELSFGHADLNVEEAAMFAFPALGPPIAPTRIRRTGGAIRTVLPFGATQDGEPPPWSWWLATVPSAIEIGVAYDRESRSTPGSASEEVDHWGLEVSFMEILIGRVGYVDDKANDVQGMGGGLGIHLPIGSWGSVGYDWARSPQPVGLDGLNRHGFSAWLHPRAIWSSWRSDD